MAPYTTAVVDGSGTYVLFDCCWTQVMGAGTLAGGTVRLRADHAGQPRGSDRQRALHKLRPLPGHGCPSFLPWCYPSDQLTLEFWCCFDDDKVTPATFGEVRPM